jgi:prepilin-type processing-associated H-X9-DG protein
MGLLLPAVQKAREAANRSSCANNLKNVGLALHHFENTRGRFPPGEVIGPLPIAGVVNRSLHGCWPFLLPYLEQQTLYDRYRWDVSWNDPANQFTDSIQLKILQCPSAEPNRVGNMTSPTDSSACTDYAPLESVSSTLASLGLIDRVPNYNGAMANNFMASVADITDGTSNTIFIGENAGRPSLWRVGQSISGSYVTGGPWASQSNRLTVMGSTPDGTVRPGACALNCTNFQEVYSFHTGGANALFGDGAVRFLGSTLSVRVLAKLITRAGGEVISADEY